MKDETELQCEVMREIMRLYDDGKIATVSMLVDECDYPEDRIRSAVGFLYRNGEIERKQTIGYVPVMECKE